VSRAAGRGRSGGCRNVGPPSLACRPLRGASMAELVERSTAPQISLKVSRYSSAAVPDQLANPIRNLYSPHRCKISCQPPIEA
jgi:hypothetical protein